MPTISVGRARLFEALGQAYTDEPFDELWKPGFEAKPLETIDTAERDEHGLLVLQREVMKRAAALGRYSATRLTPTHLCACRAR